MVRMPIGSIQQQRTQQSCNPLAIVVSFDNDAPADPGPILDTRFSPKPEPKPKCDARP